MPRRRSRRIVVDTDIARAAGTGVHPTADACRAVLETVRDASHKVVLSPQQNEEWTTHRSRFTGRWLRSMVARRQQVILNPEPDSGLAATIATLPVPEEARDAMLKDAHLLEMALATDRRVLSMDEAAYAHFQEAGAALADCRSIHWANPLRDSDDAVAWLNRGAPADPAKCIGQRPMG